MSAVIDRQYCLSHPFQIARLFGLDIFLGMLLSSRKTLLERVTEKYQASRIPFPGTLGNAYRLSALFEFRAARLYAAMARRFRDQPDAARLFSDLSEEEMEHGRVMLTCLFQVTLSQKPAFVPSIRDPEIRAELRRLRALERTIDQLSLDQALDLAIELERGEVNVIFGRLLGQVESAQLQLFAKELTGPQSHATCVPKRIQDLRRSRAAQSLASTD
jgi:rubrerythrin